MPEPASVSVITTTYRRPAYLAEALDSIASQTTRPKEVIVVNNDIATAADVARAVADHYPSARVIDNPTNLGQSGSKNVGIKEASGPIIAILDDDDRWDPRFLAAHVEAHQDPAVQVVYSGHVVFWDDVPLAPKEVLAPPPPTDVFSEMIRGRFTIATNSVLTFKRAALDAVGGYDTMLTGFLDWDLLCRVAQRGRFAHIPAPLALFRMHLGVRDSDPSLRLAELGAVREKWSGYPAVERMIRRFTAEGFYNFSRNCGLRGDRAGARRYFGLYLRHLHPDSLDVSALLRLTILVIVGRDLYCRLQRRSQWRRTKRVTTVPPSDS